MKSQRVAFVNSSYYVRIEMATTTTEIGSAGERIVANALMDMRYQTNVDTRLPGSTDIEAIQNGRKLLVQVKAAVWPSTPSSLSSEEKNNTESRATRLGCEPWEAKVQLDTSLRVVGNIEWRNLA
jgi:hypothetical protein